MSNVSPCGRSTYTPLYRDRQEYVLDLLNDVCPTIYNKVHLMKMRKYIFFKSMYDSLDYLAGSVCVHNGNVGSPAYIIQCTPKYWIICSSMYLNTNWLSPTSHLSGEVEILSRLRNDISMRLHEFMKAKLQISYFSFNLYDLYAKDLVSKVRHIKNPILRLHGALNEMHFMRLLRQFDGYWFLHETYCAHMITQLWVIFQETLCRLCYSCTR